MKRNQKNKIYKKNKNIKQKYETKKEQKNTKEQNNIVVMIVIVQLGEGEYKKYLFE